LSGGVESGVKDREFPNRDFDVLMKSLKLDKDSDKDKAIVDRVICYATCLALPSNKNVDVIKEVTDLFNSKDFPVDAEKAKVITDYALQKAQRIIDRWSTIKKTVKGIA
jgi:formiminotetrahydrofolate cyclodeaminase